MKNLELKIPEEFFEEENRCGFLVTKKRKQLWAIELDLLFQVQKICEKYNLRYYALGGTLLGAVRHNGFIPWDDDIDLIMPREDYDIFISIAQRELHERYFISYTLSEKAFFSRHIYLRNSQTTGYKIYDKNRNNNKGVYIDIMPMDVVPATLDERNQHRNELKNITRWIDIKRGAAGVISYQIDPIFMMKYVISSLFVRTNNYDDIFRNFEKVLKKYENQNTGYVGHASISYGERGIWPVSWYEKTVLLDFEFMKINAPGEYMKVLYKYFGDECMKIPDLNNLPSNSHGELIIDDINTPFTEKFNWSKR